MNADIEREQFEAMKSKVREEALKAKGPMAMALKDIRHKIAILSGKGGVGKTVVTVNLASALKKKGYEVCIFDADLHGPAVPKALGLYGRMDVVSEHDHPGHHDLRFNPLMSSNGIKVVSVASMWASQDQPIMWKGAHKMRAIRQLIASVNWGRADFLLVDLPPGTGDEVQTVMRSIPKLDGMIVVTTPQGLSTMVCTRAISAARELDVPLLGLVENMSWLKCPSCATEMYPFGKGQGEKLARLMEIPFWGKIPIELEMGECVDEGVPFVDEKPDSDFSKAMDKIVSKLMESLGEN